MLIYLKRWQTVWMVCAGLVIVTGAAVLGQDFRNGSPTPVYSPPLTEREIGAYTPGPPSYPPPMVVIEGDPSLGDPSFGDPSFVVDGEPMIPIPFPEQYEGRNRERPPIVLGKRLKLLPGETATERALKYRRQLAAARAENERLTAQVAALEASLAKREKELGTAIEFMRKARVELNSSRMQMTEWKNRFDKLSTQLRNAQDENIRMLKQLIPLLQKRLGPGRIPGDADNDSAADAANNVEAPPKVAPEK